MTPYQKAGFNELSLFRVIGGTEFDHGSIVWLREDDGSTCPAFSDGHEYWHQIIPGFHDSDLKELPKDADGFYLWEGGECPVPGDWEVKVKHRVGIGKSIQHAGYYRWEHSYQKAVGDIIAFKPLSRPDMPRVAQSATDETASALDVQEGYEKLAAVLQCALDQAQGGKGAERHAQGQPFHEQPMQRISQLIGSRDGMAFQAIKKIQESQRFEEPKRVINELLGAINYVAGMIIYLEAEALEQQEGEQ